MNGARKPRVSLRVLAYCRWDFSLPFSLFFFRFCCLRIAFFHLFFLFFLSYYTIRGELFLRGGWSGVRGHLGRLHYSLSMSLSDQNPVDIGAEFGFLPHLITNCIIIGTGIGGKKCRLMYNPGQITADGKSVSYWTSSNISQPTYILYTSSVCIYRFKTPVTFLSLSLYLAPHDSSTSFDPFEILFQDGTKGIAARGESYTRFFHEWSTSFLFFFIFLFFPSSCSRFLYTVPESTSSSDLRVRCRWVGNHLSTSHATSSLLSSPSSVVPFLLVHPTHPQFYFFFRWSRVYLSPFLFMANDWKAQVRIRSDGVYTHTTRYKGRKRIGRRNSRNAVAIQTVRSCSNNFL